MSDVPGPSNAPTTNSPAFLNKYHAILIDELDSVQLEEYLTVLATKVSPAEILFASRIPNDRICIYLKTKTVVDDLIDVHRSIVINGITLPIQPLVNRNKKITLSNVPPFIPNTDILKILNNLGVHPTSEITSINAALSNPVFSHVMSFSRQVYVRSDDVGKVPVSLRIPFYDEQYWIYLSADSLRCYRRKSQGHADKDGPNYSSENDLQSAIPHSQFQPVLPHLIATDIQEVNQNPTAINENTPGSIYTIESSPISSFVGSVTPLPNRKQRNTAALSEIETEMNENPLDYAINFRQLRNLLEARRNEDLRKVVTELDLNVPTLNTTLREIHLKSSFRGLKNKITRLMKRIDGRALSNHSESPESFTNESSISESDYP